ncbi:MAG: carboxypeptidase-like regulatory domain-containing protein, partial [Thermoplasmatota archaeon]
LESELTGESYNCCYFEEQCPEEKRNMSLECPSDKPIGCNAKCEIFPCKLNFKINANVNKQNPLCWCGINHYNTSTEEGYCCGETYDDSYYLPQACGSAVGRIYGYIKNSTGNGIKDARVLVKSNLYQRLSPASNRIGYYEIKDLMPGDYSLIATAFGYNPAYGSVKLVQDSEFNFTLYRPGEQQCSPEIVNLTYFSAEHVKGKPFVKLTWVLNQIGCENIISSFIIKRNDWNIAKYISSNERSFVDDQTSLETTYNYSIQILFKGGSLSNILYAEITTGDYVCENVFEGEEFCYNPDTGQKKGNATHRRTCDENNKISEYVSYAPNAGTRTNCEENGQICVILKNKKTDCRPKSKCLIKGLPLGLFFNIPSCLQDFCVYDYSSTNVDACFDCTRWEGGMLFLKKCYDFNSEFACNNNNCNLNCTWKYTNQELNKGICYPTVEVENESACDVCNQLFMHCSSEDCSLLGNCYKNNEENF